MFRTFIPLALLAAPFAAQAQAQGQAGPSPAATPAPTTIVREGQITPGKPPQRVRSVTLTKNEPCPKAVGDEVVVCKTLEDPYRLPKEMRQSPTPPANQSWVRKTEAIDDIGRKAGGLPDTCSVVGTGGQSGCSAARIQAWGAERRAQRDADAAAGQPQGN